MWLDRRVLGVLRLADGLHDHVRLREPLGHVAHVDVHVRRDVLRRVVDSGGVLLVMNDRCPCGEGPIDREDRGKLLVADADLLQGLEGDLLGLRRDGGDAVPHEANLGVEHARVVGRGLRVSLSGGRVARQWGVLVREDAGDPGETLRLGGVDLDDPRVRVGAMEDLHAQGPREVEVPGELRLSRDQGDAIHLALVLPDHHEGRPPLLSHGAPPASSRPRPGSREALSCIPCSGKGSRRSPRGSPPRSGRDGA